MERNGVSVFEMLFALVVLLVIAFFVLGVIVAGLGIGEPVGCDPNKILYYRAGRAIDDCNPFAVR